MTLRFLDPSSLSEELLLKASSANLALHAVLGHTVPSPASQILSGTQPSATALHRAWQAPRRGSDTALSPQPSAVGSSGCQPCRTGCCCLATSISGWAGLLNPALRERWQVAGEVTPADRWTARSYSIIGRAHRNNNTAETTCAPSSSVPTRSGGEALRGWISSPWPSEQPFCWESRLVTACDRKCKCSTGAQIDQSLNYPSLANKWFHICSWLYFERDKAVIIVNCSRTQIVVWRWKLWSGTATALTTSTGDRAI